MNLVELNSSLSDLDQDVLNDSLENVNLVHSVSKKSSEVNLKSNSFFHFNLFETSAQRKSFYLDALVFGLIFVTSFSEIIISYIFHAGGPVELSNSFYNLNALSNQSYLDKEFKTLSLLDQKILEHNLDQAVLPLRIFGLIPTGIKVGVSNFKLAVALLSLFNLFLSKLIIIPLLIKLFGPFLNQTRHLLFFLLVPISYFILLSCFKEDIKFGLNEAPFLTPNVAKAVRDSASNDFSSTGFKINQRLAEDSRDLVLNSPYYDDLFSFLDRFNSENNELLKKDVYFNKVLNERKVIEKSRIDNMVSLYYLHQIVCFIWALAGHFQSLFWEQYLEHLNPQAKTLFYFSDPILGYIFNFGLAYCNIFFRIKYNPFLLLNFSLITPIVIFFLACFYNDHQLEVKAAHSGGFDRYSLTSIKTVLFDKNSLGTLIIIQTCLLGLSKFLLENESGKQKDYLEYNPLPTSGPKSKGSTNDLINALSTASLKSIYLKENSIAKTSSFFSGSFRIFNNIVGSRNKILTKVSLFILVQSICALLNSSLFRAKLKAWLKKSFEKETLEKSSILQGIDYLLSSSSSLVQNIFFNFNLLLTCVGFVLVSLSMPIRENLLNGQKVVDIVKAEAIRENIRQSYLSFKLILYVAYKYGPKSLLRDLCEVGESFLKIGYLLIEKVTKRTGFLTQLKYVDCCLTFSNLVVMSLLFIRYCNIFLEIESDSFESVDLTKKSSLKNSKEEAIEVKTNVVNSGEVLTISSNRKI